MGARKSIQNPITGKMVASELAHPDAVKMAAKVIVINVLKFCYERLTFYMTVWENLRTQSSFENSFTVKLFWF